MHQLKTNRDHINFNNELVHLTIGKLPSFVVVTTERQAAAVPYTTLTRPDITAHCVMESMLTGMQKMTVNLSMLTPRTESVVAPNTRDSANMQIQGVRLPVESLACMYTVTPCMARFRVFLELCNL